MYVCMYIYIYIYIYIYTITRQYFNTGLLLDYQYKTVVLVSTRKPEVACEEKPVTEKCSCL